jgi:hypothetical protein
MRYVFAWFYTQWLELAVIFPVVYRASKAEAMEGRRYETTFKEDALLAARALIRYAAPLPEDTAWRRWKRKFALNMGADYLVSIGNSEEWVAIKIQGILEERK